MTIKLDRRGAAAYVALQAGKAGNPVSRQMMADLAATLGELRDATVVVLSGDGTDFTVGRDRSEGKAPDAFANFALVTAVNEALSALSGVVIAAVRGQTHGFGVGAVLRADLAIAARSAHFWLDEVKLGIPPMFIMERMLRHLPPKQALDIVLSSREFSADEALAMGLVSRVVPDDRPDAAVDALVSELLTRSPEVLRGAKRYLAEVSDMPDKASNAFALTEQARFAHGAVGR